MARPATEPLAPWRERLHEVIFEADTPRGRAFDIGLFVAIALSVVAVVLESVESIRVRYGSALRLAEWSFTVLFTVEYVLRLLAVRRPLAYATSFLGIVDILAFLPTYLSLFVVGTQSLVVVRALRLLRIFRVFKIGRYVTELGALVTALRASRAKIAVFLLTLLTVVLIMGTLMYVIEGETNPGFESIPRSVYWAIVTVTTVGYGDIAPQTTLGRAVAAAAMVLGYTLIIIPTGIFAAELVQAARGKVSTQACPACSHEGHDADAVFCKHCGAGL